VKTRRVAAALLALVACSRGTEETVVPASAVAHGEAVFNDPSASPSRSNRFACSTCHAPRAQDVGSRILPGAVLAGVTERKTFWFGQEDDLLRSVNHCRALFMGAPDPWTRDAEEAKVLYAYLAQLPKESPEPVRGTIVGKIADLPPGDAARGAVVYEQACRLCHGEANTARGRLTDRAPLLPEQTIQEHTYLQPPQQRLVFVEKVRHGVFLGYSGTMPPFTTETLSDADLGALLSFLQLYR
jgi:thiosulfate dehydrogenase